MDAKNQDQIKEEIKELVPSTPHEGRKVLEYIIQRMIKGDEHQPAEFTFWGHLLQCLDIRWDSHSPTAGIAYRRELKKFQIFINPSFYCQILKNADEQTGVLVHELYHATFKHVFCDMPKDKKEKTYRNVAMDLVINQVIKGLPEWAMFIKSFKQGDGSPFPPNQTWQTYVEMLKDPNATFQPSPGDGDPEDGDPEDGDVNQSGGIGSKGSILVKDLIDKMSSLDSHDEWGAGGEGSEQDGMDKASALKDLIDDGIRKSEANKNYGNMPAHIKHLAEDLRDKINKFDAKRVLILALRKSLPSRKPAKTWLKPSRRWGDVAKGRLTGKMPSINVYMDTSGSIGSSEIHEFVEVLNKFFSAGVERVKGYFFHTSLYGGIKIDKNFKVENHATQSGGTDLQCVVDHISKHPADLNIILTDGYYGDVDCKTLAPTVFVISRQGTPEHPLKRLGKTVKNG